MLTFWCEYLFEGKDSVLGNLGKRNKENTFLRIMSIDSQCKKLSINGRKSNFIFVF